MTTTPESRPNRSWKEELTATGDELVARVRELVEEGNVRRLIVKHDGRTLLEVPLTLGVVGALLAPQIAAIGAVATLVTHCQIIVERADPEPPAVAHQGGTPLPPGDQNQA